MIPLWLQKYVGGNDKGSFRGTHLSWTGVPLSERIASGNSHTLGTVCAFCNNGWMSCLESDFRLLLPRLQIDMTPRNFSKEERQTIAAWIIKTGIVAQRSANYRAILPDYVPRALSQGTSIPSGIKVFGGMAEAKRTVQWVQSNLAMSLLRTSDLPYFDAKQTFVFVLSITNIFIGFGWHGLDRGKFEIFHSGDATHLIYPHPKTAKQPRAFDDLRGAATEVTARSKGG